MTRTERRRAMREAGLSRDTRRAIAFYRAELRAGRHHCITVDLVPWVYALGAADAILATQRHHEHRQRGETTPP